jgi:hypothetical protein
MQFENTSLQSAAATITHDDDNPQSNKSSQGLIESQQNQQLVKENEIFFNTLIMDDGKCDPFCKEEARLKAAIVVISYSLERRETMSFYYCVMGK